jgi:hypothetical protein
MSKRDGAESDGCESGHGLSTETHGEKRWAPLHPQTIGAISWGEAMHLWSEAMRLRVIPWGEAIKNY